MNGGMNRAPYFQNGHPRRARLPLVGRRAPQGLRRLPGQQDDQDDRPTIKRRDLME